MSSLFHIKNKPFAWDSLNEWIYALGLKMLSLSQQPKSVALCWLSEKVMRRSLVCRNTNRPSPGLILLWLHPPRALPLVEFLL